MTHSLVPPFTYESAVRKVRLAENAWNSRDPERVSMAYSPNSRWRNRESGAADMIAIGRPYIANPDYVERLANGWPLAENSEPATWFTGESGALGYTSFANYTPATAV